MDAWTELQITTIDPFEFNADGSFSVGHLRFGQDCSLQDTRLGPFLVNKPAGVGQVLSVRPVNTGVEHRFRYDGSKWWRARAGHGRVSVVALAVVLVVVGLIGAALYFGLRMRSGQAPVPAATKVHLPMSLSVAFMNR